MHTYHVYVRDSSLTFDARGVLGAMVSTPELANGATVEALTAMAADTADQVRGYLAELVDAGYVTCEPTSGADLYKPTTKAFATATDDLAVANRWQVP